jgi:hypothetical protein
LLWPGRSKGDQTGPANAVFGVEARTLQIKMPNRIGRYENQRRFHLSIGVRHHILIRQLVEAQQMEINSIDSYIDRALKNGRFKSDSALDRALDLKGSSVSTWRNKKALPSEDTMLLLAKLAAINPLRALADLHFWSAKSPAVRQVWQQARDELAG